MARAFAINNWMPDEEFYRKHVDMNALGWAFTRIQRRHVTIDETSNVTPIHPECQIIALPVVPDLPRDWVGVAHLANQREFLLTDIEEMVREAEEAERVLLYAEVRDCSWSNWRIAKGDEQ